MPSEPVWLDAEDVVALNLGIVQATGEPHQIRDFGLLESACSVPTSRFYYQDDRDVVVLAAALMTAIARNHSFSQGNERTAFAAGQMFLRANGYSLNFEDDAAVADLFVEAIQSHVPAEALETVLRRQLKTID